MKCASPLTPLAPKYVDKITVEDRVNDFLRYIMTSKQWQMAERDRSHMIGV